MVAPNRLGSHPSIPKTTYMRAQEKMAPSGASITSFPLSGSGTEAHYLYPTFFWWRRRHLPAPLIACCCLYFHHVTEKKGHHPNGTFCWVVEKA